MDELPVKDKTALAHSADAGPDLASMSDDELLEIRICDLKRKIAGTELESRTENLYVELAAKGITLKPLCYLGEEWFCPEGYTTIAIPFYPGTIIDEIKVNPPGKLDSPTND